MGTTVISNDFEALVTGGASLRLSAVLIATDGARRGMLAGALREENIDLLRECNRYPDTEDIQALAELGSDIVIVDLDGSAEQALDAVEGMCSASQATVMVCSSESDGEMMILCMRAGAREFLTLPLSRSDLSAAIVRASARRVVRTPKRTDGLVSVFWGAKGGAGVTTLATSFAVSTAQDLKRNTLLIDLDLPLGDAGLQLGLASEYSTVDALANQARLDGNFLSRLVAKHESGLSVLAAPGKFVPPNYSIEAVNKLLQVAKTQFDTIVVDTGSRLELLGTSLFDEDNTLHLVSQVGIAELRNSNRLVTELFNANAAKMQVILNRFSASMLSVDEQHITKALTMQAQWRIPEETVAARKMQDTATPLTEHDLNIARTVRQMTRAAAGLAPEQEKKKKLMGFFKK